MACKPGGCTGITLSDHVREAEWFCPPKEQLAIHFQMFGEALRRMSEQKVSVNLSPHPLVKLSVTGQTFLGKFPWLQKTHKIK